MTLSPCVAWGSEQIDDDTLTFAFEQEVEALNFYQSTSRDGVILSRLIWDTLIWRDPYTGDYKPLLATSWTWVDNVTIDFELREGVTFHNGETFDADDVVFTFNYFPSPEAKAKSQQTVSWIKGAEKLGDYKVRLHLKNPFPESDFLRQGVLRRACSRACACVGPRGNRLTEAGSAATGEESPRMAFCLT